jgi:hypothetical protein
MKRIEDRVNLDLEKWNTHDSDGDVPRLSRDVVRLARVLDEAVDLLGRLTFAFDPSDNRHADLSAERDKLKRVLEEVGRE